MRLAYDDTGPTRASLAYTLLRRDIIAGERQPNERLRIERLSKLYNVGPTPLREALQRLSADGLVLSEGNRGFAVAPLDIEDFRDLNIARTCVEREALRLSIVHGDDEWEAQVAGAAYRLAKEDRALKRGDERDMDRWERANTAFHYATVSACGSSSLLRVRQRLQDQCERYRRASVFLKRADRALAREHGALAEAVLARDTARACALIEHHFATTADILADELTATGGTV